MTEQDTPIKTPDDQNGSETGAATPLDIPKTPVVDKKPVSRPVPVAPEKTMVQMLNADEFDGKLIVLELSSGKVFLVPSYEISYRMKPQEIQKSVLASADQPYDWSDEIAKYAVDPGKARVALAREGFIRKEDADDGMLQKRLKARGVIKPEGSNG